MKYYAKGKTKKIKMIAIAIKGFTGTIGASAVLMEHQYWGLAILAVGAAANEVLNFINTEEKDDHNQPV